MAAPTSYYKVLNEDGSARNGGSGRWHLPKGNRPGKWMPKIDRVQPCVRGYHVCERDDLLRWLGPAIFEAEIRGVSVRDTNKTAASEARLLHRLDTWNERSARMFAADCAGYAVRQCEKSSIYVDDRVKESIRVVYAFALGEASSAELSAARSAAWSAAVSAAWSAERSAAAESAAKSAAESAAWSAERSVAWSAAARSAAWSAARSAAWSAAESAAWSAPESAAWSAAMNWQTKRLFEYLEGKRL